MDGSPGALTESFAAQVSVLSELISACLEERLRSEGLSLTAFELMSAIHSAGLGATQAEVSRRLGIAAASLSESVKTAVAKGLVTQEDDPRDRRIKRLVLTNKGQRILQNTIKALTRLEEDMLAGLPDERLLDVADVLRHATKVLAQNLATA